MGRLLFIVPPLSGHVNPTLGLGSELLKNGHEVAWISFDPRLGMQIPEGGRFILLESDISEAEKERIKNELVELGKNTAYGLDSLKFLYDDVLIPMNTGMLEGIKTLVDAYHPDVIINDHQVFAGAVAAIQKNIPYVTSVTAPAAIKVNEALPMVYAWEGGKIIEFQQKMGINGDVRLDCSSLLSLVYTSRYFFGDSEVADYFHFVGPILNRNSASDTFDWERFRAMGNRPKILVSIGTTFDHNQKQQFFTKVVEAFGGEDISVVVVSDPALFEYIPGNFMICKYVPQLDLLPHIDAVVCHGGHNTVCEALWHAKPLVVLPIAYDQSYVAGCVTNSGSGIRLNFNRFKAGQLKDAVYTVLNDKQYVDNAKIVSRSFIEAGGAVKAASLVENMLSTTTLSS